ncbi:GntR family transcriptional regulator [Kyrpidia spormannii]|uniref:GntR family transcriptional regulator n=2 Tax=Kyrpidia spormannii TaxID=2055160 RepID=A0A2K8N5X6_9BACL|nr:MULTISPECIES: GntR family transcriptional regulator [Kyrpidia]HHY65678.1 GntR family transcriptional regulator [Alicyclobacillus sp.]ATY84207.1 GntR family transcriptional regulator [Kyrpidia spormannii]MCL6576064.1 GntR family transcriptional regulator [Kyrpidia sp.]CAB3390536.1 GntR family transcriptional regulator [Kyrpidia spormannii]CAB3391453.1 GntR family transcriptional regulator [Kyrpidia spormannii]
MSFPIVRKNGIPLYIQVKEAVLAQIRNGHWKTGDKLPTERELSERLQVSRNTVSQAYQELEAEGVLTSIQGRGTFVCDRDDAVRIENRKDLLMKIIDVAMEEGLQLGFSIEEFAELTAVRARQKRELLNLIQVTFIECNREQVDYFARRIQFRSGVSITPVVLDELRQNVEVHLPKVTSADLVITTFFHYDEVKELLGPKRNVLAISLEPQMDTIVRIARIPVGRRIGLVCRSENFAGKVQLALKNAGLDGLDLSVTTTSDPEELEWFVGEMDSVIVSPGRRREVERLCRRRQEVIEFVYQPDVASINLLRAALIDVRRG